MLPSPSVVPVTVKLPAIVVFAPLIVMFVVAELPDFILNSPLLFVNLPNSVPPSFKIISAPSASSIISAALSNVMLPLDVEKPSPNSMALPDAFTLNT